MRLNQNDIDIEILPLGDYPLASCVAKVLECRLVLKYRKTVRSKISVKYLDEIEFDPNLKKLWGV